MSAWTSLSSGQKVAAVVGVSAGAGVLYVCYSRYWRQQGPGTRDVCEVRMKILKPAADRMLEKKGALRDWLAKQTGTCIQVSRAPDAHAEREVTIRGSPTQVRQAQELISDIIQGNSALQVELHLPGWCVYKVVGAGGERIREIGKTSGAAIHCERKNENNVGPTRCITIAGERQQVEAAKALIKKLLAEDASVSRAGQVSTFRSHRKEIIAVKKKDHPHPPEEEENSSPDREQSPESFHTASPAEENQPEKRKVTDTTFTYGTFVVPSPDYTFRAGEFVDVYVSASENPEHFWIQILGSRFSQLDKLTTEMTNFYRQQKATVEIQVGDIVAAPFRNNGSWYRAQVTGCLEGDLVDLYYVDYGDNWKTPKETLFPLRSDFLSLPFQAVECGLSNILPKGGSWSEEALDTFDVLTHCATWEPLLAKISRFPTPEVPSFQIQLFDPSCNPMVNIGQELIKKGFAVACQTSPQKTDDMLVSRLLVEVTGLPKKPEPPSFTKRQEQERLQESNGSIDVMRADVHGGADPRVIGVPSPPSSLASLDDVESLEQSLSKIHLGDCEVSSSSGGPAPSTSPSVANSSVDSSKSSSDTSSRSSTSCTTSEGSSVLSSSLEDSSVYSPRGCFYYLSDEPSTSSILAASSSSCGEIVTISSDSEGEVGRPRKAPVAPGVFASSPGVDVIVVDDD
ncbi:tudor and KH domain-containing protein [Gastrophryne carolinensis]